MIYTLRLTSLLCQSGLTVLPEGWETLRYQWEYSHAASAILNFVALFTLLLSVLGKD